jgi:5-(aminomethyl)-3-furanmethanol phosphate kinase
MIARLRPDAVLKVGGSLSQRPRALRRLMTSLEALARTCTLVVVPGGGRFADEVRRADRRFGLGSSSTHWMAILAMDQLAHVLCDLTRSAVMVRSPREVGAGRLNVLAPSMWLIETDPLPHSWDVTSDSIAAWVARALEARRLILVKSADAPVAATPGRRESALPRGRATPGQLGDLVDPYFAQALSPDVPCWIVNGTHPERIATLLATGSTQGTEVIGEREERRLRRREPQLPSDGRALRRARG